MNFVQIDPTILLKLAQQVLKNRIAELRDIYAKTFGKYGRRDGSPVGGDVKLEIIPDNKVAQRSLEEATRLPNLLLKWLFKLLPEVVLDILLPKYRALGQPFPYQTIDESTLRILSNDDIGIIRGRILQGAIGEILQDTGKTVGFFSRTTKTIYIGASQVRLDTTPGPLAHEFAHAPANFPIEFALRWAQVRGLGGSDELARAVVDAARSVSRDLGAGRGGAALSALS